MFRLKKTSNGIDPVKKLGIFSWSIIGFLIIAALCLYIIYLARIAIIPVVIAAAIAYLIAPLVVLLQKKMRKVFAVAITYVLFIGVLAATFSLIIPAIIDQFKVFLTQFPLYLQNLDTMIKNLQETTFIQGIERLMGRDIIPEDATVISQYFISRVSMEGIDILQRVTTLTRSIINIILYIVIGLLLGLYILKDIDKVRAIFIRAFPKNLKLDAVIVIDKINMVASRYIRGQLMVSVIVGVLCTAVLLILKVDFAILFGFVAGLFNLVPLLGPIIGAIPAALAALFISPLKALLIVVFFIVIQQVDNFVISPYVMRYHVGVHPGLIIFSLMAGGALFGMWGLLIAVPTVAILQETLRYYLFERNKTGSRANRANRK